MNLVGYLNAVHRSWLAQDGDIVAAFVSLKDRHVMNRALHLESPENMVERHLHPPLDEVVSEHLKTLYWLTGERKN